MERIASAHTDRIAEVANTCPLEPIDNTTPDATTTTKSAQITQSVMRSACSGYNEH